MSVPESPDRVPNGQMQCQCCREEDCPPAECETDSCIHHSQSYHCHCEVHIALLAGITNATYECPECGDPLIKREEK